MKLTFVHAADLHLDSPFEGLGRLAPDIAEHLRDSSLRAWDGLVDLCLERQAAFLLLAGDIYDGEVRGVRAQIRFLRGLERLSAHGIQVFIAHGNHDPATSRWSAIRDWPAGVVVFPHDKVLSVPVLRDGRAAAVVHGISYASHDLTENLAVRFRRGSAPCLQIGVLHCNVDGDRDHPLHSPCSLDDLRQAGMDYWALGHIHRHRALARGEMWAVYAGCLQGRSLKSSERGLKGAVVVRVEDDRVVAAELAPVPHVRFVQPEVDVADVTSLADLVRRLDAAVVAEEAAGPATGFVARARLTGSGPVHLQLREPDAPGELLRTLREDADGRSPFLWWSDLHDATRPELDRDAIRRRADFSADLLRLADALADDEERLVKFAAEHAALTPALQRWNRGPQHGQRSVLEHAATLALERLERRDER